MSEQREQFECKLEKSPLNVTSDQIRHLTQLSSDPTGKIPEQFRCPLCLSLVFQPKSCTICLNLVFCQPCIASMQCSKCPVCRKGDFCEPREDLMEPLEGLKLLCGRGDHCITPSKTYSYASLVESHSTECLSQKIECFLGCGEVLSTYSGAKEHFSSSCPQTLIACGDCDAVFVRKLQNDHK